jgi:alanyl-tRNA synthetase
MSEERIYYDQPYLTEFEARVVACDRCPEGYRIRLDRCAFYPASGGQPNDLGVIGEARVLDVVGEGDEVVCIVDREPGGGAGTPAGDHAGAGAQAVTGAQAGVAHGGAAQAGVAPGPVMKCRIDWDRRFDFMQQHTGQHILSASFEKLLDAETVGFHLTEHNLTVDLDIPALSREDTTRVEAMSNSIVFEDRPVAPVYPTRDELAKLPLRKPPARTEGIRVIVVKDFDHSPCGGTHVSMTGQVGIIKVLGWEKVRAGTRVAFACGSRAVADYGVKNDIVSRLSSVLSVPVLEIEAAARRLTDQNAQYFKRIEAMTKELLAHEAAALASAGTVVAKHFETRDLGELRMLAGLIAAAGGKVAVLGSSGPSPQVIVARSDDLDLDARKLIEVAKAVLGGRGGGSPKQAQAGGQDSSAVGPAVEAVRQEAMKALGLEA